VTSLRLRAVVLAIAASLLAGCATERSAPCPPVVAYSPEFHARAADELASLKEVVAEQALERRRLKKAGSRMGETTHEISRRRDARAIQPVGAPHAGTDRRAQRHLLPLVRSLSEPVAPEALED
jgi:hypothetical protein